MGVLICARDFFGGWEWEGLKRWWWGNKAGGLDELSNFWRRMGGYSLVLKRKGCYYWKKRFDYGTDCFHVDPCEQL